MTSRLRAAAHTPPVDGFSGHHTPMLALEAPAHPKHEAVILERVVWHSRGPHETAARQAEGRPIVERHGKHKVQDRIVLIAHCVGIDNNIRLIIASTIARLTDRLMVHGRPVLSKWIGETERKPAADAHRAVALPGRDIGVETLGAADGEQISTIGVSLVLEGRVGRSWSCRDTGCWSGR